MAVQAILGDTALNQAESGDARATLESVDSLVARHTAMVFRICYSILRNHHDAEDATQECFLRMLKWQNRLHKVRNHKTWLARIAWTTALDRRPSLNLVPIEGESDGSVQVILQEKSPSPEDQASRTEMRQLFDRMVRGLPDELRQPLELSTVEELNSAEIGDIMQIPESSVRTRLFRARKILKEKLAAQLEVKRHG